MFHRRSRRSLIPAALMLVGLPVLLLAGTEERKITCPVDGGLITARITTTRHASGGVDSDGCSYRLVGKTLAVHGEGSVLTCPRCKLTLRAADFARRLTPNEAKAAARAIKTAGDALAPYLGKGLDRSSAYPPAPLRYRLAVICYRALGHRTTAGPIHPAELEARLLLAGAWAERGAAMNLAGGAGEFLPRTLKDGLALFRTLGEQLKNPGNPALTDVRDVDAILARLERLQRRVETMVSETGAAARFRRARLEREVTTMEQTLLELRRRAVARVDAAAETGSANEARSLRLRLAQAADRLGLDRERRRHLAALERETLPERLRDALESLEVHFAAEQALLEEALTALRKVPVDGHRAPARLLVLRADLARRTGDLAGARRDLADARARSADPDLRRLCATLATVLER